MKSLVEYFQQARKEKWAIGHFNFSTADQLRAVTEVAAELKSPVMVGTSEGESKFLGYEQAVALVRSWQKSGYAVFLNADHHKNWENIVQALEAGYDSVLIDASSQNLEANIQLTKKVVDYAGQLAERQDRVIPVEGELGYLRGESQVQEKVLISRDDFTKPEEAQEFVKKTGVDRLAIAFGNIHGLTTNQEMQLDWAILEKVSAVVPEVHLVLHGGSGLSDQDFQKAISLGVTNIHISTELRLAYQQALQQTLRQTPQQIAPYQFLNASLEAAKKIVRHKIEVFGSPGKI